jgi:hypothetical protein
MGRDPGVAADPADPLFRADVSVQVDTKLQPFRPGRFKRRLTCTQPAEVTAVFSGTSKLWTMQRDSPHRQRFAVGITAPVQDLSAADAVSSEAPLDPTVTARPRTTTGLAGKGNLRVWQPHKLDASDGRSGADVEVVGGWVRHWARHQTPLVVHFRAPWVSYRSFGSCYVRLPRLLLTEVAEDASLDIQPSSGDAPLGIVTFAGVNAGLTRLNSDGTVVGDISQPRPSAFGGVESFRGTEDAIWRCQAKSGAADFKGIEMALRANPVQGVGADVYDQYARVLGRASTCEATAVVTAPWASWAQALILILVGTALPVLCTLAVRAVRSVRSRPSTIDTKPSAPNDAS